MLSMIDEFIDHLVQRGNNSLIARIYGIYTIKTNAFADVDFLVMQNTVRMSHPKNSKMVFDLKGSTTNRLI